MRKPRLIYENDARHHLLYRYAPPLSVHRLRQPVDEDHRRSDVAVGARGRRAENGGEFGEVLGVGVHVHPVVERRVRPEPRESRKMLGYRGNCADSCCSDCCVAGGANS